MYFYFNLVCENIFDGVTEAMKPEKIDINKASVQNGKDKIGSGQKKYEILLFF